MKELSEENIAGLLEAAYELRDREFKPPFTWGLPQDRWVTERVIRAVLGMTNTRLGGTVIIGIESRNNGQLVQTGLADGQLESFRDYDRIKGTIDGFASTTTHFDIGWAPYKGKPFVIIAVEEFMDVPVICKKNGQEKGILQEGDIYVRSLRGPYSTIRATEGELRQIIKMAVDNEKAELAARGWARPAEAPPEQLYYERIKDLD